MCNTLPGNSLSPIPPASTCGRAKQVLLMRDDASDFKPLAKNRKLRTNGMQGTQRSGKSEKTRSRKQAIAIGLPKARKKGARVPPKKKKS